MSMKQPLTAKQISGRTGIDIDTCSHILCRFADKGITECLNPKAHNSRLHWLTPRGRDYRKRLHQEKSLTVEETECDVDSVNWDTYGLVCYRHRSAIIRILTEPMQPSAMKRRLRRAAPNIAISSNNIRDIVKVFLQKGIVQKVFVRKKAHPRYELTDMGRRLRKLLLQAEVPL